MQTVIVKCKVQQAKLPMGSDNLILVEGDRLTVSKQVVGSRGKYVVYSVNECILPKFYISKRVITTIGEVENGSLDQEE